MPGGGCCRRSLDRRAPGRGRRPSSVRRARRSEARPGEGDSSGSLSSVRSTPSRRRISASACRQALSAARTRRGRLIVFLEIGERGRELDDRDAEVVRDHVVEFARDPCPLGRHRLPGALFPLGLCCREVELQRRGVPSAVRKRGRGDPDAGQDDRGEEKHRRSHRREARSRRRRPAVGRTPSRQPRRASRW